MKIKYSIFSRRRVFELSRKEILLVYNIIGQQSKHGLLADYGFSELDYKNTVKLWDEIDEELQCRRKDE
jgi:hypothetical protein